MAPRPKLDLERLRRVFRDRHTGDRIVGPRKGLDKPRHSLQKEAISKIRVGREPVDSLLLNPAFNVGDYDNHKICLFNVIVALEWIPDRDDLESLRTAFEEASARLYDVTDGYMVLDQVVVGGPELMQCADIQILASNRLFPRSSVDGLNKEEKYQPIRLGRGLWRKDNRTTFAWDCELGFETIVHEWLHYALGLKDQYLQQANGVVTPTRNPVKETAMADVTITELTSRASVNVVGASQRPPFLRIGSMYNPAQDESEWEAVSKHFDMLGIDPDQHPVEPPPAQVPFPTFHIVGNARLDHPKLHFTLDGASGAKGPIDPDHCWVFVVKGAKIEDASVADPVGLIAQGSYTTKKPDTTIQDAGAAEPESFPLLGADVNDVVVLVGYVKDTPALPQVLWATIQSESDGAAQMSGWYDATPASFPIIGVEDTSPSARPPFSVELSGFSTDEWAVATFPLGQLKQALAEDRRATSFPNLPALDGHVMLLSRTKPTTLAIASYSLGGSPSSAFPGHPNPIPAGSADGNAMIFFYDDQHQALRYNGVNGETFDRFRVVTTTNLQNTQPPPDGWEPRSYTFTITTNQSFDAVKRLNPTLVLYYDQETRSQPAGELVIGHYNPGMGKWEALESQSRDQRENFLVAVPLNQYTAQGLYAASPQAEQYRLFLRKALPAS